MLDSWFILSMLFAGQNVKKHLSTIDIPILGFIAKYPIQRKNIILLSLFWGFWSKFVHCSRDKLF